MTIDNPDIIEIHVCCKCGWNEFFTAPPETPLDTKCGHGGRCEYVKYIPEGSGEPVTVTPRCISVWFTASQIAYMYEAPLLLTARVDDSDLPVVVTSHQRHDGTGEVVNMTFELPQNLKNHQLSQKHIGMRAQFSREGTRVSSVEGDVFGGTIVWDQLRNELALQDEFGGRRYFSGVWNVQLLPKQN